MTRSESFLEGCPRLESVTLTFGDGPGMPQHSTVLQRAFAETLRWPCGDGDISTINTGCRQLRALTTALQQPKLSLKALTLSEISARALLQNGFANVFFYHVMKGLHRFRLQIQTGIQAVDCWSPVIIAALNDTENIIANDGLSWIFRAATELRDLWLHFPGGEDS